MAGCGASLQTTAHPRLTWQLQTSGTRQPLYDVACLTELRCEAVGGAGAIVATANGGETWQAQANPLDDSSAALYRIACAAPSSCYVIARPDTILVTHDSGATWTSHRLGLGLPTGALTDSACLPAYTPIAGRPELCRLGLLGIACVSAADCQAVATTSAAYGTEVVGAALTAASSIWSTRDGGATWITQAVPAGVVCDADCDQKSRSVSAGLDLLHSDRYVLRGRGARAGLWPLWLCVRDAVLERFWDVEVRRGHDHMHLVRS